MTIEANEQGMSGIEGYEQWWRDLEGHLGGIYPFYNQNCPDFYSLDPGPVLARKADRGEPLALDVSAVACKVCLPYLLGNRTLVKGVERAPWVERLVAAGEWEPLPLPSHGSQDPDPDDFVASFVAALELELESYLGAARTVGILLSGGMDSRVVAGVLRKFQESNPGQFSVVALTWGDAGSRDVVYAKRIAGQFGWGLKHFPLTAETLARNIELAGQAGAEVSGLHLHAMPEIAQVDGLDLILAGSYGDSVGRAEFSGKRVNELKPILPANIDPFGVLKSGIRRPAIDDLLSDARASCHFREGDSPIRTFEIEQEMHYMRRMLQSCMFQIARNTPLYQMFTAPSVFGMMWQLAPEIRGDRWYERILQVLPGRLLDIPWARTGGRYLDHSSETDGLPKSYHSYGRWLRNDLRDVVVSRVNGDRIRELGLFNDKGLDFALKAWVSARTEGSNSLDELMAWLASLHAFLASYPVTSEPAPDTPFRDTFSALRGGLYGQAYIRARNLLRD